MKNNSLFSNLLLKWFEENQRIMPWRGETDPYKIWVSEIILQQTRVKQGWNYYLNFIEQFPNVELLAKASLQEVLHIWQGLGYYSRARNMHLAAQNIIHNHQGIFPHHYLEIKKLKGIGNYTAAAIASIAFQLPYPAVDGNVLRVITRIFGIYEDISQKKTVQKITQLCLKLMDEVNPGNFNQALMEFGAIQCTPKNPKCESCPFISSCLALKKEHQALLPVKTLKTKVKNRFLNYFIFFKDSNTIIEQRTENNIWKNLYQFPLIETQIDCKKISKKMISNAGLGNCKPIFFKDINHKLTHRHLFIRFYIVNDFFPKLKNNWLVTPVENLNRFPFPVALKNILSQLIPAM